MALGRGDAPPGDRAPRCGECGARYGLLLSLVEPKLSVDKRCSVDNRLFLALGDPFSKSLIYRFLGETKLESLSSLFGPRRGFWGPISILTRWSCGDIMLVTVADFNLSEGSSCFTLATVGVIGKVRTGMLLVSAVTVLVSAFTLEENLGDAVTHVTEAVQVSVTILSSDFILLTLTGLPGALGGPFTSPNRSVLPVLQAVIGT